MSINKKVLIFSGYYLPGYRAGGPVKSIKNLIDNMEDKFDFYIITRDRDLQCERYNSITKDEWISVSGCRVMYVDGGVQDTFKIIRAIKEVSPDVVYVNSFFDFYFSIRIVVLRKLGFYSCSRFILAPRGEFSNAALALGRVKKYSYLFMARIFNMYSGVVWQASTEYERKDIANNFYRNEICVAKDLPSKVVAARKMCRDESFQILFLSRISPMKNLDYALNVLSMVKKDVIFHIYGPIEDETYWRKCSDIIRKLPRNITVKYKGVVIPDDVSEIMAHYDLFFLPTRGENYGHVVAESLLVGTPVLISDRTPWRGLETAKLGWDLPLDQPAAFAACIDLVATYSFDYRCEMRSSVLRSTYIQNVVDKDIEDNLNLLNG